MTANRLEVAPAFTARATTVNLDYEDSLAAGVALDSAAKDLRGHLRHAPTDEHFAAVLTAHAERLERVSAALSDARMAALRKEWSR